MWCRWCSLTLHRTVEGYHLYGCLGSFGAFVAEPASRAVESLLLVKHGEHSEYHRDVAFGIQVGYALGDA